MDEKSTTQLEPAEAPARVRAARGYADLSRNELQKKTGISASTIERIEKGKRPASNDEVWAVADACGLPRLFFYVDFEKDLGQPTLVDAAKMMRGEGVGARAENFKEYGDYLERIAREMRDAAEILEDELEQAARRSESSGPRTSK